MEGVWWWCISARLCVVSAIVVRRRGGRAVDTNARRPELSALPMYIPLRLYPRRPSHIPYTYIIFYVYTYICIMYVRIYFIYIYIGIYTLYAYIRLAAAVADSARAARSPDPRNAVVSVGGHRRVSAVPTIRKARSRYCEPYNAAPRSTTVVTRYAT